MSFCGATFLNPSKQVTKNLITTDASPPEADQHDKKAERKCDVGAVISSASITAQDFQNHNSAEAEALAESVA